MRILLISFWDRMGQDRSFDNWTWWPQRHYHDDPDWYWKRRETSQFYSVGNWLDTTIQSTWKSFCWHRMTSAWDLASGCIKSFQRLTNNPNSQTANTCCSVFGGPWRWWQIMVASMLVTKQQQIVGAFVGGNFEMLVNISSHSKSHQHEGKIVAKMILSPTFKNCRHHKVTNIEWSPTSL